MSVRVPLQRVLDLANPVEHWPWLGCRRLSEQTIRSRIGQVVPVAKPLRLGLGQSVSSTRHLAWIRHLMIAGWDKPIVIDVGVPALGASMPHWPVLDGNHRLAAAILRGDADILVEIQGQISYAAELFDVSEEDLMDDDVSVA